jgi:glycosyltransferase involved in cell wall biosynthesis
MARRQHRLDVLHLTLRNESLHPRIFYKEAVSQAIAGIRVGIIGLSAEHTLPLRAKGCLIIPLAYASSRLTRLRKMWAISLRLRPRVLHLHTPELLPLVLTLRLLLGVKLVYDMHEDYLANRRYGQEYTRNRWWKVLQGQLLRGIERLSAPFLAQVCYAERCYGNLLRLPVGRSITLENKALKFTEGVLLQAEIQEKLDGMPRLLVSGTIAKTWGVFEAVAIWAALNQHTPVALVVAGFAPDPVVLLELKKRTAATGFAGRFQLIGGDHFVSPLQIWELQQKCELGLACYRPAKHIKGRIPTKFYEYLAAGRPLFYNNQSPVWDAFLRPYYPSLGINPAQAEASAASILAYLKKPPTLPAVPESVCSWSATEAPKLRAVYAKLLVDEKRGTKPEVGPVAGR